MKTKMFALMAAFALSTAAPVFAQAMNQEPQKTEKKEKKARKKMRKGKMNKMDKKAEKGMEKDMKSGM